MSRDENRGKTLKYLTLISQIGISMLVPIGAGIFFGNLLDKKLGTNVLFLAIFSILGIIVSFMNLFKMSSFLNKPIDDDNPRDINRK